MVDASHVMSVMTAPRATRLNFGLLEGSGALEPPLANLTSLDGA
jgi:hypothetical protein